MNKRRLKRILKKHEKWIAEEGEGGKRAILSGANLKRIDLSGANLCEVVLGGANLFYANLSGANLCEACLEDADLAIADLHGASLKGAYLKRADLSGANLRDADLECADLRGADLLGADLRGANLDYADLAGANLTNTMLDEKEKYRLGFVAKTPIKGWKKCRGGVIVELEIPCRAIVFSINGQGCRTNIAKVISITNIAGENKESASSYYQEEFVYRVGETIEIEDFNFAYNKDYASGIHFFLTKEEAEKYRY